MPADKAAKSAKPATPKKTEKAAKAAKPKASSAGLFGWLSGLFRRKPSYRHDPSVMPMGPGSRLKPRRKPMAPVPAVAEGAHLLLALKDMLDRNPRSRSVLVHLALVEKALRQSGLKGLQDVPSGVLHKALSQLETLVSDWSQGDLAALRGQIKSALGNTPEGFERKPSAKIVKVKRPTVQAPELNESRLEVNEASVTTFMEARAQWERSATGGR